MGSHLEPIIVQDTTLQGCLIQERIQAYFIKTMVRIGNRSIPTTPYIYQNENKKVIILFSLLAPTMENYRDKNWRDIKEIGKSNLQ